MRTLFRQLVYAVVPLCLSAVAYAEQPQPPLVLLIQPTLSDKTTRELYQPMVDYLVQETGRSIKVITRPNFMAHWETVRRNDDIDLALDDAQFTDYRTRKLGFKVLTKLPGTISYSLIVSNRLRVRDPLELAGVRIASFVAPSTGAARLNAMFPSPSRRPVLVEISSVEEGVEILQTGKAEAAMLPTPFVAKFVADGGFKPLTTTEPIPNMALSASSKLNINLRDKIRIALLSAENNDAGKAMLKHMGIERFESATAADYAGYDKVLRELWGY
jgi:ABC-type phosphate/phosphonate transport system substrate-binding protein